MEEALGNILYDSTDDEAEVEAVYITPPEPSAVTDEESGDEEDPNRFNRNQLSADAEIQFRSRGDEDDLDEGFYAAQSPVVTMVDSVLSQSPTRCATNECLIVTSSQAKAK